MVSKAAIWSATRQHVNHTCASFRGRLRTRSINLICFMTCLIVSCGGKTTDSDRSASTKSGHKACVS